MELIFQADVLPRTMTKAQWREVDRWRRVIARQLREDVHKRLQNLAVFGTSHPELIMPVIDSIINPPVMVYPEPPSGSLSPRWLSVGAVCRIDAP